MFARSSSRPWEKDLLLGHLKVEDYLRKVQGRVAGCIITDAKDRQYRRDYVFDENNGKLVVRRKDGNRKFESANIHLSGHPRLARQLKS